MVGFARKACVCSAINALRVRLARPSQARAYCAQFKWCGASVIESQMTERAVVAGQFDRRAMAMFVIAIAFLALFAAIVPHGGVSSEVSEFVIGSPIVLTLFFAMWLAIVGEGVLGYLAAPDKPGKALRRLALVTLIPPFRMTMSPLRPNTHVWLPRLGWIETGKAAVADMELRTAMPMLAMTALIIPVIITDFALGQKPHDVLSGQFEAVTHFETSDNGQRLFLLDKDEAVRVNVVRPDRSTRAGIDGRWIVLGIPEGAPTTALTLDPDNRFTFRTDCAVTEGAFANEFSKLSFSGVEKTAKCPPSWLEIVVYLVTALIWFSFAFEFILMVSLADKKLAFCKKNWINIVIILLPLLAFLRSLQIFRFLRMARAGKLMRAYRLRGLVTRMAKLAMIFNLIERFLSRKPEKFTAHLSEKIAEKEDELAALKAKLANSRSDEG